MTVEITKEMFMTILDRDLFAVIVLGIGQLVLWLQNRKLKSILTHLGANFLAEVSSGKKVDRLNKKIEELQKNNER